MKSCNEVSFRFVEAIEFFKDWSQWKDDELSEKQMQIIMSVLWALAKNGHATDKQQMAVISSYQSLIIKRNLPLDTMADVYNLVSERLWKKESQRAL